MHNRPSSIKKQTVNNKRRRSPQIDYDKLLKSNEMLVNKRIHVVETELQLEQNSISNSKIEAIAAKSSTAFLQRIVDRRNNFDDDIVQAAISELKNRKVIFS